MANSIDLRIAEEAIRAMRYVIDKKYPNCEIMLTCAPGEKDKTYNRFVLSTHKIYSSTKGEIVCYISYRSKRPEKNVRPVFSSYEIFDTDYKSLTKIHIDHNDGTLGRKTFDEVLAFVKTLLQ